MIEIKNKNLLFIEKSNVKHSNKYSYELVNYINNKTQVMIICPNHGYFSQRPDSHLRGIGCAKCSNSNIQKTNDEFIQEASIMFNNRYNYSKCKYINNKSKVEIICKKHGSFFQNPNSHLRGIGCPVCSGNKKYTLCEFIKMANLKHHNKFTYNNSIYRNNRTKISINCKIHGDFQKQPYKHLLGEGCPVCSNRKRDIKSFIDDSSKIHNNKYDYSNTIYLNIRTKVEIYCKKHGIFKQLPSDHLRGVNCPNCKSYGKMENKWLDSLNVPLRQFRIDKYTVDGYDPKTNTVYEFNGDYWHGNPNKYNGDDINRVNGEKFSELLRLTKIKENKLRSLGYKITSIWESEFII